MTSDTGALLAINRYDEYGRTETTSSTYMGRFGYTGQRYFSGFGLYHYKNRMYDPAAGRFLQTDPIGYGAGMNLYGYVGGDPVNLTDPSGLAPKKPPMPGCTGTRIPTACGGGGIAGHLSGFSTAGVGGQAEAPTLQKSPFAGGTGELKDPPQLASLADCARGFCGLFGSDAPVLRASFSLGELLNWIFNPDQISEYGRPVEIADLGLTSGGVVTISGWIMKDDKHLYITINNLHAESLPRGSLFVYQGLNKAFDTAQKLGLSNVTISGVLANEQLQSFLMQVSAKHGGWVSNNGSWITVDLPVRY